MMQRLTAYDRPFYGRADNLVLGPLNPSEIGDFLGLSGSGAIDAQLISGGLPGIVVGWPNGTTALDFLDGECADPASRIFSVPEQALNSEFPNPDVARRVIEAIGDGDRTFANIASAAGGRAGALPSGTLSPLLHRLVADKQVLAIEEPLATQPGKPARYRVADSNLRLYLGVLRQAQTQAARGRAVAARELVRRRWSSWRGRAVEPVIREALTNAALDGDLPWEGVQVVGGWWNRQFNPEIDIVGADRGPIAERIGFAGSIKWLDAPFDQRDLESLRAGAARIPGFDAATGGPRHRQPVGDVRPARARPPGVGAG
ncbi:DUF234 domain-containing protein [Actinoplanes sp. NPDC051851]|uniref:DUF234 domain-containing protein n=1 Tax=Actinoplanes sp. NPDC051851 TaxID=3154753 RepID=UPI00341470A3